MQSRELENVVLVDFRKELTDLVGPESPMATERADRRDFASTRPTGHGLGIDAKHCCHLRRREESIVIECVVFSSGHLKVPFGGGVQ